MTRLTASLLLLSGCAWVASPPSYSVEGDGPLASLSVESGSYAPADSVQLRLTPFVDIGYGTVCKAYLERLDDGVWERYRGESQYTEPEEREGPYPGRVCTDILIFGSAGRTERHRVRLSDRVESGTYRFRHRVSLTHRGHGPQRTDTLATGPFEIQR